MQENNCIGTTMPWSTGSGPCECISTEGGAILDTLDITFKAGKRWQFLHRAWQCGQWVKFNLFQRSGTFSSHSVGIEKTHKNWKKFPMLPTRYFKFTSIKVLHAFCRLCPRTPTHVMREEGHQDHPGRPHSNRCFAVMASLNDFAWLPCAFLPCSPAWKQVWLKIFLGIP